MHTHWAGGVAGSGSGAGGGSGGGGDNPSPEGGTLESSATDFSPSSGASGCGFGVGAVRVAAV